ncbi:MAG: hypothetical protein ACYC6P_10100 [Ignavibacteriaceae bacterium]
MDEIIVFEIMALTSSTGRLGQIIAEQYLLSFKLYSASLKASPDFRIQFFIKSPYVKTHLRIVPVAQNIILCYNLVFF